MEKKTSLKWYKFKEKPKTLKAYDGSQGAEILFKARTNSLEVNERKKRWGEEVDERCEYCNDKKKIEKETLEHVIIECQEYKENRKIFMEEIKKEIGEKEWQEQTEKEDRGLKMILGIENENEVRPILESTKKYLETIFGKKGK